MADYEFTTGPTSLPDVGECTYNACTFSPFFTTSISGKVVQDAANRTTKLMEYSITIDGYVTAATGDADISSNMDSLRASLLAQAGPLTYTGRGFDLNVNIPGGTVQDVAWGPIPELIEFTPLGASIDEDGNGGALSAKVKWTVKTRISEVDALTTFGPGPVLQFNIETTVSYGEDWFSNLSVRGTLEVPLTRVTPDSIVSAQTVDDFRDDWLSLVNVDLKLFRPTRREIHISRDKRTMEWAFDFEEIPYMGLPPYCTIARGTYSFRPAKTGMGLSVWLCTLRVTYTVTNNAPRRTAWLAFLTLLRIRLQASQAAQVPGQIGGAQNPPAAANAGIIGTVRLAAVAALTAAGQPAELAIQIANRVGGNVQNGARAAWIIDFSGEEGVYLDSKTITFSCTWRLLTSFSEILLASGIWTKSPNDGGFKWATTMQGMAGPQSWLKNQLDPDQDVIVDFGNGVE